MTDTATWSFVDLATGEFTGGMAVGGIEVGTAQPAGILPVLGIYPRAEWRYDTATGMVVRKDEQQGTPPDVLELRRVASDSLGALAAEEGRGLRALIECVLAIHRGEPLPEGAVAKLLDVEGALISLRPVAVQALSEIAG